MTEIYTLLIHDLKMLDKFQTIMIALLAFFAIKNGITISKETGISFAGYKPYIRVDDMKLIGDIVDEVYKNKEKNFYVTNKIIKDMIERALVANHIPKDKELFDKYVEDLTKHIVLGYRTEIPEIPLEIDGLQAAVRTVLLRNRRK